MWDLCTTGQIIHMIMHMSTFRSSCKEESNWASSGPHLVLTFALAGSLFMPFTCYSDW